MAKDRVGDAQLLGTFRDQAYAFRGHCGQVTNWLSQPVPFPYYHVLNLMLVLNLGLISYVRSQNPNNGPHPNPSPNPHPNPSPNPNPSPGCSPSGASVWRATPSAAASGTCPTGAHSSIQG